MALSQFSRSYNSFSGADIKAVFNERVVADLQAVSFSITREKAPIFTMGNANARAFSRGKRGIAGTLIFIVFDRHGLLATLNQYPFLSDKDDLRPESFAQATANANFGTPLVTGVAQAGAGGTSPSGRNVYDSESELLAGLSSDQELSSAWYADQIPPFDVTLAANNEYGAAARMVIYGVECLNEGSGFSIDDMVVEKQVTYVAREIDHWKPVSPNFVNQVGVVQN